MKDPSRTDHPVRHWELRRLVRRPSWLTNGGGWTVGDVVFTVKRG